MLLTKAALGQKGFKRATVETPEWGGSVLVRELTGAEVEIVRGLAAKAARDGQVQDSGALGQFSRQLIVQGWINEDGSQALEPGDAGLLANESNQVIERIADAVATISGLKPGAVEQAEKN